MASDASFPELLKKLKRMKSIQNKVAVLLYTRAFFGRMPRKVHQLREWKTNVR